jgi:hypothetical protein
VSGSGIGLGCIDPNRTPRGMDRLLRIDDISFAVMAARTHAPNILMPCHSCSILSPIPRQADPSTFPAPSPSPGLLAPPLPWPHKTQLWATPRGPLLFSVRADDFRIPDVWSTWLSSQLPRNTRDRSSPTPCVLLGTQVGDCTTQLFRRCPPSGSRYSGPDRPRIVRIAPTPALRGLGLGRYYLGIDRRRLGRRMPAGWASRRAREAGEAGQVKVDSPSRPLVRPAVLRPGQRPNPNTTTTPTPHPHLLANSTRILSSLSWSHNSY